MIVELPQPYDFALSLERYRTFGPDLVYLWDGDALHRVLGGREVRITEAEGGVSIEPCDPSLVAPVQQLLGATFDLDGFGRMAGRDPVLAMLVAQLAGFRPPLAPDPFEQLVSAITAQQISLRAALAIRNRLVQRFSDQVGRAYAFPTQERLRTAGADELIALGFSARKAHYVTGLARADLDFAALAGVGDDEVVARLTELPGLGRWSAEWFLARHLGRPDVWPAGDLGLRKAVSFFYLEGRVASETDVRELGARFAPYRNLAAHYLLTGMRMLGS